MEQPINPPILRTPHDERAIYYTLRIAIAMCFIGHGAFGIITKPIWCNYFAVFGFGHDLAYRMMPWVGSFDILLGIVMLVYPIRAIPAWLVGWGLLTALLRPLSGEPFAEFMERAGNFGAPLSLLLLTGVTSRTLPATARRNHTNATSIRYWLLRLDPPARADMAVPAQTRRCLQVIAFLLLLGHGWLNIIEKKSLLMQYQSLGFANAGITAHWTGIFEITAAFLILLRPIRTLLLAFFIWKIASELFYPHYELFEWIERGGSYGSLLALWLITPVKYKWNGKEMSGREAGGNGYLQFNGPV